MVDIPLMLGNNSRSLLIVVGELGEITDIDNLTLAVSFNELDSIVTDSIVGYRKDGYYVLTSAQPIKSSNLNSLAYNGLTKSVMHNGLSQKAVEKEQIWGKLALAFGAGLLISKQKE